MECYKIFAKNLTALREELGLTKQNLSIELGFSRTRIGALELKYDTHHARLHEAIAICEYFKVSLDHMAYLDLTGTTNKETPENQGE